MASRWFVFWMALFVVSILKEQYLLCVICLVLAITTKDPQDELKNNIYLDTKRLIQQFFDHYFGKNE